MPYSKMSEVPENLKKLDDVPLTLAQANAIAAHADGLKGNKEIESPWLVLSFPVAAVAFFAESYKIIELVGRFVVSLKMSEGDDVMHIKGETVLFRCFATVLANLVSLAYLFCYRIPFGSIVQFAAFPVVVLFVCASAQMFKLALLRTKDFLFLAILEILEFLAALWTNVNVFTLGRSPVLMTWLRTKSLVALGFDDGKSIATMLANFGGPAMCSVISHSAL
jgi:hypothetical protein